MDFSATIDLIIKDLEEARIIIDDLRKYPGVPAIQVELAKAKCKSAADVIALLKDINSGSASQKNSEPKTEVPEKPERHLTRQSSSEIIEIEPEQVPEIILDLKEDKAIKTNVPVTAIDATILADRFGHASGRINEELGIHKGEDDLTARVLPVSNLSDAIGINDRFLFIREIFEGDKNRYSSAISKLDSAASLEDAKAILMSYTGKATEDEATKRLLDLVKRKFPIHG